MARPKWASRTSDILDRMVERVAIAALAAIAARGSGESLAALAVTIFIIVVIVEEFGRSWFWFGKRITLRDVAFSSIGQLRLQRRAAGGGRKKRKRRSRARSRRRATAGVSTDQSRSHV